MSFENCRHGWRGGYRPLLTQEDCFESGLSVRGISSYFVSDFVLGVGLEIFGARLEKDLAERAQLDGEGVRVRGLRPGQPRHRHPESTTWCRIWFRRLRVQGVGCKVWNLGCVRCSV